MLVLCNCLMLGDASGFAPCRSLADVAVGLFLGFLPPLTKQDCPALHAGASFCFVHAYWPLPLWVAGSTCMCALHFDYVLNMLVLAQLKMPASMQEHCVAALLRLHKKQIMRLRSPEDFIQVQPLCVTACNILHPKPIPVSQHCSIGTWLHTLLYNCCHASQHHAASPQRSKKIG